MTKPWDADASKPGAPTSLDVLIGWLLIPGNYQSWQSGNKTPLMQEIVDELKKQGTSTRSPAAIRLKIFKLEQQYQAASNWLKTEGKLEVSLRRGQVDEDAERSVLQLCPMYRQLTPVFQPAIGTQVKSDEDEQETEDTENSKASDASADEESKPANPPVSVQGKHKRTSTEPEIAGVDSSVAKRGKQGALILEDDQMTEEMVALHSAQVTDDENQALDEFHRGSEHRWNQYWDVSPYLGQLGDEMARQSFNREAEHAEALAELRFEVEKKRLEVRSNCENTLLRHKLRTAGVSEEEVASSIPE